MKIRIPALRHITKYKEGLIIKEILRAQVIEVQIIKHINETTYYTFRYEGNDVLIAFENLSKSITSKFTHVIKEDKVSKIETEDLLDISAFNWIKHPLLKPAFLNTFTKEYVTNSWNDAFQLKTDVENDKGLRVPQVGALYAIQAHWTISKEPAIVVLPTGTGKTDVMIACTVMSKPKTLLIIVPTDALRDQISFKFLSLGVLPQSNIVTSDCENPILGVLKHRFTSPADVIGFFDGANIIVATMSVISGCSVEVQKSIADLTSHFFVDEAHHTPADTWRDFKDKFKNSRIILFTATPFRNDGKRLNGKIIYNFPLRRAQELEYFKPIHFKPIYEHQEKIADQKIALTAVEQLKNDLSAGYDHILMVRVNEINRAEEVYQYYAGYVEYSPVLVHSQIKPNSLLKSIIQNITNRKHRIIICVDMLGEGFDLPELKIAAFHDTKKSLTITLQLAGRFTRVKSNLGPATFIANIADQQVHEDLENLYYRDSDWNELLPDMSYKLSLEQEDFRIFLEGFKGFPDKFPIQSIRHPLSTIIFQTNSDNWDPKKYRDGIKSIDSYQYVYSDYNQEQEILIIILGKRRGVKWAKVQDFESINWDIIICFFDKETKLLYLHASNTNSYYMNFVQSICPEAKLINGQIIFRCFHGINRIRLHNVGVREPMGRAINFIMRVGSDIKTALRDTELKKAIKSNVFGVGFEYGNRQSIGCSHHGRIWSMRTNDIITWMKWCKTIAAKVTNPSINPDIVLKGTLIPEEISRVPDTELFTIEWPDVIYRQAIGNYDILKDNEEYPIWNCDIAIVTKNRQFVDFEIQLPSGKHLYKLHIFENATGKRFDVLTESELEISDGGESIELSTFFQKYPPLMYFVDGSFLEGNLFTKIESVTSGFSMENFELHDWKNVDIRKESQTFEKLSNTVQYSLIQKLIKENQYVILMDDDDKGEIGDVIGFKVVEPERVLFVDVYHCKFSSESEPGIRVKDFYEVCGQAQRCIKWMERPEEIFRHLSKRNSDRLRRLGVSRFEVGDQFILDILSRRAKRELIVKMNVFIVQPGLSFGDYREDSEVSRLLSVVENYLRETWNARLKVLASE